MAHVTTNQNGLARMTPMAELVDLGVLSPRHGPEVVIQPGCFVSASVLNRRRLQARITSAEAEASVAQKAAQTVETLSKSLKEGLRAAKKTLKKTRRLYKEGRRALKSLRRKQESAEKNFRKASARLEKLRAKWQSRSSRASGDRGLLDATGMGATLARNK